MTSSFSAAAQRPRPALPTARIAVAVTGSSPAALLQAALEALRHSPLVELRLDSLAPGHLTPTQVAAILSQLLDGFLDHQLPAQPPPSTMAAPDPQLIATCRRIAAGGHFAGSPAQELDLLRAAAAAGFERRAPVHMPMLIDLALESAAELGPEAVGRFRAELHSLGAALLISAHNFTATAGLEATLAAALALAPDAVKIVSTARTLGDNLALRRLLATPSPVPIIAMAMGEAGLPSRVLGPVWGSLFTFASLADGAETAPGQVSVATLRGLYRAEELSTSTRVFGVAGKPVAHSLSPRMHSAAFRAQGLDAVFLPLPTDNPQELLAFARELPLAGLAITMPLKTAILPLLDRVDPLAARVGAANTVVREADGALAGYNTDVAGVLEPLAARMPLAGARVLVLGAGGAARAAVFGLVEAGAEVTVCNRTPATAEALAQEAGAIFASPAELDGDHGSSTAPSRATPFDALIHATPAGMGGDPTLPAPLHPHRPLPARLVFEMIYHPRRTPLVALAEAQGIPVLDGLAMFTAQGARQSELWTGLPAPHAVLRAAIEQALAERAAAE